MMRLNQEQRNFLIKKMDSLQHSKFRSQFHLRKYMIPYIEEKGMDVIEEHAYSFVIKNLSEVDSARDGHQTPMKGHPVFLAQHACACCCRGCLEKWHHIPKGRKLTEKEIRFIVALLMFWIQQEYNRMKKV